MPGTSQSVLKPTANKGNVGVSNRSGEKTVNPETQKTTDVARVLTGATKRRAWMEKPPRPWLIMAGIFVVVSLFMASTRVAGVLRERKVIESGVTVSAKVTQLGISSQHQAERDERVMVGLEFTLPGETTLRNARGFLPPKPGVVIYARSNIDVKVDPTNPTFFTDSATPPPIGAELGLPVLLLSVGLICIGLAAWRRAGVLRVLRYGQVRSATVASVRQTPVAPLSKQVAVSVDGIDDRRLALMYVPNRNGSIKRGDSISVVVIPADPTRLVSVKTYDILT